jgi:hypothetical protein
VELSHESVEVGDRFHRASDIPSTNSADSSDRMRGDSDDGFCTGVALEIKGRDDDKPE